MFTRKRFNPSQARDIPSLAKYLMEWFNLLNQPGSITIDNADIRAATGVKYPSDWGAKSADVNTLDDYQEGSWTPTLTSSSGLITAYTATGLFRKVGSIVLATIDATITTNGTGSGYITSDLPFLPNAIYCGGGLQVTAALTVAASNLLNKMYIAKVDGTYPGGDGASIRATVCYGTV